MRPRSPAVIDGCIWACAADELEAHAERLKTLYGVTLSRAAAGGLAIRSSRESGLCLLASAAGLDPGVWGIVLATDDVPAVLGRFPAAARDESARAVHDALQEQGLTFAGRYLDTNVYLRPRDGSVEPDLLRRPPGRQPYVYLFVWVVRLENLERHAGRLAALLDADFEGVAIPGGRVAMSWDAGLELIAPEPRELRPVAGKLDEATTDVHYDHVVNQGEGPWSVVLRVADIGAFRDRAARLGYDPSPLLQEADPSRRRDWYRSWTRKVIEQRETRLPGLLGLRLMAGQVTYAAG
jgi:hypothetical protein